MSTNFYRDNRDIQFCVKYFDLSDIAELYEYEFADRDGSDYAPVDAADALDNYDRTLDILGGICANFIAPRAEDVDREGAQIHDGVVSYPRGTRENLEALTKADMMGFTLPRKYGGLNLPRVTYAAGIELVSRADASLMTIFGLQDIAETIHEFGDEQQKDSYLPRFASGEVTGAMVLTEPDAGSDLQAVQLKAAEDPSEEGLWRLNGVKRFITNGCGDVLLVLARTEPGTRDGRGLSMLLCDKGPAVVIRRIEDKLGIHGSPTCEMQFNNAPARLVGKRRRGLTKYVMSLMNGARIGIAAQGLGVAEAAYHEGLEYAKEREQFGKKIIDMGPVAELLADMKMKIEAARALLYDTCRYVDYETILNRRIEEGKPPENARERQKTAARLASILTPMSKYYCTELANRAAFDALQIHGGSGFMRDYPIERIVRDARITNIYEGTSQLQVVAILAGLLGNALNDRLEEFASRRYEGKLAKLQEKVLDAQKNLFEAVDHARNRKTPDYVDLAGKQLSDMACDIYMAHILIDMAAHSQEKIDVTSRFIARMKTAFDPDIPDVATLHRIIGR